MLPDDGVLVEDVTQIGFAAHLAFDFRRPRTFVSSGPAGTLGAGFATGVGAQAALPDRKVLVVAGDGGFLFTANELATAVQHRIPLVTLVFNDGAYGNVKRIQQQRFGADRTIASDLRNPDFVAFAESFGALGLRASGPDEVRPALERAFAEAARWSSTSQRRRCPTRGRGSSAAAPAAFVSPTRRSCDVGHASIH